MRKNNYRIERVLDMRIGKNYINGHNFRPLSEIISEIEFRHKGKWDRLVDLEKVWMNEQGNIVIDGQEYIINNNALTQLIEKTRDLTGLSKDVMKVDYFKANPTHMMAYQLNGWIKHYLENGGKNKDWLFRFKDNTIRAILSDTYGIYDNHQVITLLDKHMPDLKVQYSYTDTDHMHLRFIDGEISKEVARDTLFAGLHLSNGEIGKRSVNIHFTVFQLICTNGMMGSKDYDNIYHQEHRGINDAKIEREFGEALESFDRFAAMATIEGFAQTYDETVEHTIPNVFQAVRARYALTLPQVESAAQRASNYIFDDNRLTKYAILSGLTELARDSDDGNMRFDLERKVGQLLKVDINELTQQFIDEERQREEYEKKKKSRIKDMVL